MEHYRSSLACLADTNYNIFYGNKEGKTIHRDLSMTLNCSRHGVACIRWILNLNLKIIRIDEHRGSQYVHSSLGELCLS